MRAAFGETQPFSFHGNGFHTDHADRLSFARVMRSTPAISLSTLVRMLRRATASSWRIGTRQAGCRDRISIVHVDETDEKAINTGLFRASRAYEGFLPQPQLGETFNERVRIHAKKFIGRGEPGASEIMANPLLANALPCGSSPSVTVRPGRTRSRRQRLITRTCASHIRAVASTAMRPTCAGPIP